MTVDVYFDGLNVVNLKYNLLLILKHIHYIMSTKIFRYYLINFKTIVILTLLYDLEIDGKVFYDTSVHLFYTDESNIDQSVTEPKLFDDQAI